MAQLNELTLVLPSTFNEQPLTMTHLVMAEWPGGMNAENSKNKYASCIAIFSFPGHNDQLL